MEIARKQAPQIKKEKKNQVSTTFVRLREMKHKESSIASHFLPLKSKKTLSYDFLRKIIVFTHVGYLIKRCALVGLPF